MSRKDYNLDENTEEGFSFQLAGHVYFFRYPTLEEVDAFSKTDESKQLEKMYEFVEAEDASTPPIKEALGKANIKVMQKFMEMIKVEFAGEAGDK